MSFQSNDNGVLSVYVLGNKWSYLFCTYNEHVFDIVIINCYAPTEYKGDADKNG